MLSIIASWKPMFLLNQETGGATWKSHRQSNSVWITTKICCHLCFP